MKPTFAFVMMLVGAVASMPLTEDKRESSSTVTVATCRREFVCRSEELGAREFNIVASEEVKREVSLAGSEIEKRDFVCGDKIKRGFVCGAKRGLSCSGPVDPRSPTSLSTEICGRAEAELAKRTE